MTAPQATPACAIGLPGSFTGVSELEVPHAVAGPIAARNDLARCGPLQRQRFWRRRGQPRPDLGLVIRMTGIVAPADKFALELRLEGRVRSSAGQGPGGCRTPPAPLPNNVSASRPIATVYGGGLQHVETGEADWVLTLERLGVTRDKRPLHNVRDNI
jgi:hypothetical protein